MDLAKTELRTGELVTSDELLWAPLRKFHLEFNANSGMFFFLCSLWAHKKQKTNEQQTRSGPKHKCTVNTEAEAITLY